jgi:hypothetical protein
MSETGPIAMARGRMDTRAIVQSLSGLLLACRPVACASRQASDAVPPPARSDSFAYRRIYRAGDQYRYEIQRTYYLNGELRDVATAVSVHTVVGEPPTKERIHFERLTITANGNTADATLSIRGIPAYEVSLAADAPKGSLDLPSLENLDGVVVGMITDLHTFLVAISPHAGINRVERVGDIDVSARPRQASWSNGSTVPLGQDCIQITSKLAALTVTTATIETSFLPPATQCLQMHRDWMVAPVDPETRANNFQQVRKDSGARAVMWGREQFRVRAVVNRQDGKLRSATMDNELLLKMRMNCDETMEKCGAEVPLKLRRTLTLRLL